MCISYNIREHQLLESGKCHNSKHHKINLKIAHGSKCIVLLMYTLIIVLGSGQRPNLRIERTRVISLSPFIVKHKLFQHYDCGCNMNSWWHLMVSWTKLCQQREISWQAFVKDGSVLWHIAQTWMYCFVQAYFCYFLRKSQCMYCSITISIKRIIYHPYHRHHLSVITLPD